MTSRNLPHDFQNSLKGSPDFLKKIPSGSPECMVQVILRMSNILETIEETIKVKQRNKNIFGS
jgi:hypothetical protein